MSTTEVQLNKGDRVWIEADHRKIEGRVTIISPNGRSLVLSFESIICGFLGAMPVFMCDDGKYRPVAHNEDTEVKIIPYEQGLH
jgi:hypothetical protein